MEAGEGEWRESGGRVEGEDEGKEEGERERGRGEGEELAEERVTLSHKS